MKNILIIVPSLGGGGAEKVLITLLNNIDATLYNVELLIIFNSGIYFSELPPHVKLSIVYPKKNSLCQKLRFVTGFWKWISITAKPWWNICIGNC